MSLDELTTKLEGLYDPDRPVRLVMIGVGLDSDMSALQQIAETSNQQAYEADTASDILTVLASTLLSR